MAIGTTPGTWGEGEQLAWGAAVRKVLAAMTKHYGEGRVRVIRDDEVDPVKRASTEFREAAGRMAQDLTKEDPCRETQVMFGHGYLRRDPKDQSRPKGTGYHFFDIKGKTTEFVAPGVRLLAMFSCYQLPADFPVEVANDNVLFTDTPSGTSRPGATPVPGEMRPDAYDGHAQKIADAIAGLR